MQMTTLQQHMELLLRVVSDTTARTSPVNHHADVKLIPLSKKNDIKAYFMTFIRIMANHEIRRDQWLYHLTPQLRNWKNSASICSIVASRSQGL